MILKFQSKVFAKLQVNNPCILFALVVKSLASEGGAHGGCTKIQVYCGTAKKKFTRLFVKEDMIYMTNSFAPAKHIKSNSNIDRNIIFPTKPCFAPHIFQQP